MELFVREYGTDSGKPPLLLLHGLFGSSANWMGIARKLEKDFQLLVPDLRNHGRSAHNADVSYQALADDLHELLDHYAIEQAVLVGHSMGGKAAMQFALRFPQRVAALVVVDIAPVAYSHGFDGIHAAFDSLDLDSLDKREDALAVLEERLGSALIAGYLLQNLQRLDHQWHWRLNLSALKAGADEISGFDVAAHAEFSGPCLFITGEQSDYVSPDDYQTIQRLFPAAHMQALADAGHWVYFEQPDAFLQVLNRFLADVNVINKGDE
ncbi:MAG: alpha/beta fold hydrolase [gamma proteobacterium symbiont of Bathyaustriella thionipta]|nr:alpha/beta fold hydrolase [gamma proteobacterium symbiont of Bathyaustriella thionipta]